MIQRETAYPEAEAEAEAALIPGVLVLATAVATATGAVATVQGMLCLILLFIIVVSFDGGGKFEPNGIAGKFISFCSSFSPYYCLDEISPFHGGGVWKCERLFFNLLE